MRTHSEILVTAIVAFAGGLLVAGTNLSLQGRAARPELLIGKPPVPRS